MFKNLFNELIFKKVKIKKCNFCNCYEDEKTPLIVIDSVGICKNCVVSAHKIFFGEKEYSYSEEILNDKYEYVDFFDSIRKK